MIVAVLKRGVFSTSYCEVPLKQIVLSKQWTCVVRKCGNNFSCDDELCTLDEQSYTQPYTVSRFNLITMVTELIDGMFYWTTYQLLPIFYYSTTENHRSNITG
jgi:hypothetical protein